MKHKTKHQLHHKGWTEAEIQYAEKIIEEPRGREKLFSLLLFISALILIIAGNVAVSFVLIPFLLFLNKATLYILIIFLAGLTGFLYNFLINDIRHLDYKHHITGSLLIPAIAIVNVFVITIFANIIISDLQIQQTHNGYLIGFVFAVAFTTPYIIHRLHLSHQKKKYAYSAT